MSCDINETFKFLKEQMLKGEESADREKAIDMLSKLEASIFLKDEFIAKQKTRMNHYKSILNDVSTNLNNQEALRLIRIDPSFLPTPKVKPH